jgi:hypothetical protein
MNLQLQLHCHTYRFALIHHGFREVSGVFDKLFRSQLSRGLRLRSTAAHLLRSWVRIPPGHVCLSVVSIVFCQVEVLATSWSLIQRSPTDCGVSLCVIYKNKPREWVGQDPLVGYRAKRKKKNWTSYVTCYTQSVPSPNPEGHAFYNSLLEQN